MKFTVTGSDSPWRGYTGSYQEEQAGLVVAAVADLTGYEVPAVLANQPGGSWLAIDRARRRVVVDGARFGELRRPDVTTLRPGERQVIGQVRDLAALGGPATVAPFLIRSQIVRTHAHLEAELCLERQWEQAGVYRAEFKGVHRYCTNRCEESPLWFAITIELASGEMAVEGGG